MADLLKKLETESGWMHYKKTLVDDHYVEAYITLVDEGEACIIKRCNSKTEYEFMMLKEGKVVHQQTGTEVEILYNKIETEHNDTVYDLEDILTQLGFDVDELRKEIK